tara:strand:- start:906 stop:1271 length:366 start_codon:yes stop_codon:yes gene_type:complete
MNKEIEKVFSEMGSKYGIDMKGKTPIGDLPNIMSKADWLLVSCFLKYPNGVPKDKSESMNLYRVEGEGTNSRNLETTWYEIEVVARNEDHADTLARDEFRRLSSREVIINSIECIDEEVQS